MKKQSLDNGLLMIEEDIKKIRLKMERDDITFEEYTKLYKLWYEMLLMRDERLEVKKPKSFMDRVSPDVVLTVGANILGIVLILKHEELNVISSKALNFVIKGRV